MGAAGLREIVPGSIVCEAVLTETSHLAAKEALAHGQILEFLRRLRLQVVPLGSELETISHLLNRYVDTPMDFADACVVRLAEQFPDLTVCTTDSHFQFFRKNQRDVIPLLAPFTS